MFVILFSTLVSKARVVLVRRFIWQTKLVLGLNRGKRPSAEVVWRKNSRAIQLSSPTISTLFLHVSIETKLTDGLLH